MLIDFNENCHVYSINGDIARLSVTELLSKHKLSPSYAGISKNILAEAAKRGKEIHRDIELYCNTRNYVPKTDQCKKFAEWAEENLDGAVAEQMLGYVDGDFTLAGTADLFGIAKSGERIIADHKATTKFYRESVTWQVNILNYMARKLGTEQVNGKCLNWSYGATKMLCFHYDLTEGELHVYELDKIPDVEIERLLEAEKEGKKFQRAELSIDNELRDMYIRAEREVMDIEAQAKTAAQRRDELRAKVLSLFEEQNIKSWESPEGAFRITYIPPQDRITVDSAKLRRSFPQIYSQCTKITKVKSQIRFIKKEEGE